MACMRACGPREEAEVTALLLHYLLSISVSRSDADPDAGLEVFCSL